MQHLRPTSKRDLESAISQALIHFAKTYLGRGPLESKTFLLDDLVLVRLKGVLTQGEMKLLQGDNGVRARYLLKQVRHEILDRGRPELEAAIKQILGVGVKSVHTDISTKTGEHIVVFTLETTPSCLADERAHWRAPAVRGRQP